jgi:hypothetical protein
MSSLAELPELVGFFSYSRDDDEDFKGTLSALQDVIDSIRIAHPCLLYSGQSAGLARTRKFGALHEPLKAPQNADTVGSSARIDRTIQKAFS